MFTGALARMIASSAAGNPDAIADPIIWAAHLVGQHPVPANAGFAATQLLLALGIAWRPTVKLALAASIGWSLSVWWLGEGLGGVLSGTADPLTGAPGGAIIYAVLAVLLWPADHGAPSSAPVACRALGTTCGRLSWLLLWASLGFFALADGAPGRPGPVAIAAIFGVIAVGIFARPAATRAVLVMAVTTAVVIWVSGENFGGVFNGMGTDLNSGPLLLLLSVAYWPVRAAQPRKVLGFARGR
jgi:hypothetical protein